MPEFLSPEVVFNPIQELGAPVGGQRTPGTVALVGPTQKGPMGLGPALVNKADFRRIYGSWMSGYEIPHWVDTFFDASRGHGRLRVVRTAHYTDPTNASTLTAAKATLNLEDSTPGYSLSGTSPATATAVGATDLDIALSGEVAQTISIANNLTTGAAIAAAIQTAVRALTAASGPNQPDYDNFVAVFTEDGRYLLVNGTSGASKTVVVTDAAGNNVADDLKLGLANGGTEVAEFVPTIQVDAIYEGTYGNSVGVRVTRTNKVSTQLASNLVNGDDTLDLTSVSGIVPGMILAITDLTAPLNSPATVYVEVDRVEAGLVYLREAVSLTQTINAGTTPATVKSDDFDIHVYNGTQRVEVFSFLSMNSRNTTDYFENRINVGSRASQYIRVTDLGVYSLPPYDRPSNLSSTTYLSGGADGLSSFDDDDLIGDADAATGMGALEEEFGFDLLAIPDGRTAAVHQAMQSFAERAQRFSFLVDLPEGLTAANAVTYVKDTARLSSQFGSTAWPNPIAPDPQDRSTRRTMPVSAYLAGIRAYAWNTDSLGQPPGGKKFPLQNVIDVEDREVLKKSIRDEVYVNRINPIMVFPQDTSFIVLGVRTLTPGGIGGFNDTQKTDSFLWIKYDLTQWLQNFLISEPLTQNTLGKILNGMESYLRTQLAKGLLAGSGPADAWHIEFTSSATDLRNGVIKGRVGLALVKALEFVYFDVYEMAPSQGA